MKIGRRQLSSFGRRILDGNNYKAIPQFFAVHQRPVRVLLEEVFSVGSYPRTVTINTPIGAVSVQLYSAADLSTLNLVFCRQDYYAPEKTRVVVDVGSNIGLSTLYWLTRNEESYVYCHEPSLRSFDRLMSNLVPFQDRFTARCEAVSDFTGSARLGIEESGVNSSLELKSDNFVPCHVVHVNDVLGAVLARHGQIDVLKLDSEGHELRTLEAILPEYWHRLRCVCVGCGGMSQAVPKEFSYSRHGSAERFWR